jgi:HSP20 family molecular chaperone IbpA
VSDEYDDDYNDFLERIKKYLNLDQGAFDVNFLFLPEPNFDPKTNRNDEKFKGFKVTYHFESGMDKPEIKVEGNIDKKKLQEYFKTFDLSKHPQIKRLNPLRDTHAIDAGQLSLQPNYEKEDSLTKNSYFEINFYEDSAEIIIEAPGIEKGHILLSLSEDERTLRVSIEINFINIKREIQLPFESKMDDHILEVNNGIVTIIMQKKNI